MKRQYTKKIFQILGALNTGMECSLIRRKSEGKPFDVINFKIYTLPGQEDIEFDASPDEALEIAWGMIKSGQKLFMGKRYIDVDLPEFDFAMCAESFGCYGEVVTDPNELKSAFERAKNSGKPAILDVKIGFDTPDTTKLMGSMGIL